MVSCACKEHLLFTGGKESIVLKLKNRKIKVSTERYMKDNGLIPPHASAICKLCVEYVEQNFEYESCKKIKLEQDNGTDDLIEKIMSPKTNGHSLEKIAEALGTRISSDIYNDAFELRSLHKDPDVLKNFSVETWLKERNSVLTKFLMSAAMCDNSANIKKKLCIAGSVDSLYKARRLTHVAPLPFAQNIVSYYLSGSKLVTQLNARQQAAGSYTSLRQWLINLSSRRCVSPNSGDLITFFDNNQVVARNWRVSYGHKTTASVITVIANIQPDPSSNIQINPILNPNRWLFDKNDTVIQRIKHAIGDGEQHFDAIRNSFLTRRLQTVLQEQRIAADGCSDEIDDRVQGLFGPTQRDESKDPYSWVPSLHLQTTKVMIGDPVMCNPCSYESVKKVLEHIQNENCGHNSGRVWTIIGCDGLPYTLGRRLLERNDHLQNILLVPGLGHVEINAVKGLFKLLWEPCLQDVAKMLGFRTPRALICAKNCTDHHKAWMMLSILLFGTMDELLVTYIRHCNESKTLPTLQGLYQFISLSTDNKYRFMCDIVFNYVLAIFVFRCGVRRNNHAYINAGKMKIMKLFYSLNMTNYQELMYHDLKTRTLAPPEIKAFIHKYESFTVSGNPSKGEGGDFVLENINAKTKRWLPPGIPNQSHWLQVCRNLETLEQIRHVTFSDTDIIPEDKVVYQRDLSVEIVQWRVKLRGSSYLSNNGDQDSAHTSVNGSILDRELIAFETKFRANMNSYLDGIAAGSLPGKNLQLIPVFPTDVERKHFYDIERKTKAQISKIIEDTINTVRENGDVEEAVTLHTQWQKIKAKTKNEILQFYKEVAVALENSTAMESDNEDSEYEQEEDDDNC